MTFDEELLQGVADSFIGVSKKAIFQQIEDGGYDPETSSNVLIPHDNEIMCRRKNPTDSQIGSNLATASDVIVLVPAIYLLNTFGKIANDDKIIFSDITYTVKAIQFVEAEEQIVLYKFVCKNS